jgi:sulfide:quinone oxidoreductase
MARVLVVGGSFGGLTAAFELQKRLGSAHTITLLSNSSQFVFIPSLPWVAMGWQDAERITFGIERPLGKRGIGFVHGAARSIDTAAQNVISTAGDLPYDYLLIATGSDLDYSTVPGIDPTLGYCASIFTLDGTLAARNQLGALLRADRGSVLIGSAQGASCLGPAYELVGMIDTELRRRKKRHRFDLHFVTPEPFLGHFGVGGMGKARRLIEDEFWERDIGYHTNAAIETIEPERCVLKDGTVLKKGFAMVAPPFLGVEAVRNTDRLANPKGFIPVDPHYRSTEFPNVFAVGVAVAIAPPGPTAVPVGVPKTGNMTVNMARAAAQNLADVVRGRTPQAEPTLGVVCMDDMGDEAIFLRAKPVLPPRESIQHRKGRWVRWLKIGFERYFIWKMRHGFTGLP